MMRQNKRSRLTSRLSDLHENELSHILSRLPTKDAVRTSILSKKWRYKWTSSYTVDIVGRGLNNDPELFVNFMNMILGSLQCRKFGLECDLVDLNHLQAWTNIILTHNLESLDLQFHGNFENDELVLHLPRNLLNNPRLQNLNLSLDFSTMNVAAHNLAPNLTRLYICGVEILNNHSTTTALKLSFPLLETFSIGRFIWSNATCVEIDAPLLTKFGSFGNFTPDDYKFVILSPRIAEFEYEISLSENVIVNGSSIVSVDLDSGYDRDCSSPTDISVMREYGLRVRKMVNVFTSLQDLNLSGSLDKVLPYGYPLPLLDKLKKLQLSEPINVELLLELLSKAPSLKVLALNMIKWVDFDYEAIGSVPACVVSHLEELKMANFECEPAQYNLLAFLLKNGNKLKKLKMEAPRDKRNEVKEFVSMHRVSGLVLQFRN